MREPPAIAATTQSPVEIHDDEMRAQFAFSFAVASVPLFVVGLTLTLKGAGWPFGIADVLFGLLVLGIRRWTLAAPRAERVDAGTFLIGTLGLFIIGWHALFTGQSASFALWFLPCVSIIAALLASTRLSVGFGVGGLMLALAVWASEFVVTIPPVFPVPGWFLLLCHALLLFVTTAYSVSARRTNDAHVLRLLAANQELLIQKEQLDRQADALNRSLAEAEQARAAADAANKAKSDFLAVMSHEIRTPLNGVVGLNSLLLSLPLDEKARDYAELGRHSAETLLALVNDFLDFSKIDAGRLELAPVLFDPREVFTDALAVVKEEARGKGLQLVAEIDASRRLWGDATRLRQILVNLLGNAVKFTPDGSVTLRARVREGNGGQCWLHIEVIDTGIGIGADAQRRLFQPFSQADASTTRRYGGTGLGLAICKALAQLMGGDIGVNSEAGKGSRFWVELPFACGETAAGIEEEAPAGNPVVTGELRGHVLVAEDNPVNRRVAEEMLRRIGFSVDTAEDGRQAIDAALAHDYDLVLMDCDMPVVDGFEASRAIRRREGAGRHVPIVAMTASALSGDRERCLAAGMDDYLSKPTRLEDIARMAARWVRRH
jgi:signal transduction histidine kinase/ActR/RegA family two-component response regulator